MIERKDKLSKGYIKERKLIIESRIQRYLDPRRIAEEISANDVSQYTIYKQTEVLPVLIKVLRLIETSPKSYGVCSVCGKDIEMVRLNLVPGATRCLHCMI